MIITISGPTGSGKTTVARGLAERFHMRHISAGEVFRRMAEERGLSLLEFSKLAEGDAALDREVDERQRAMAREGNAIVDGRLSGWLLEADLKIWLKAPLEVRAARVAKREGKAYDVALRETREREESELGRYKRIYKIDLRDLSPYHVVLETSLWSAEKIVEIVGVMVEGHKEPVR